LARDVRGDRHRIFNDCGAAIALAIVASVTKLGTAMTGLYASVLTALN
jgi:hypothetical protein